MPRRRALRWVRRDLETERNAPCGARPLVTRGAIGALSRRDVSWTPGWRGGFAGPAGAAHVDADWGAGGAERGAFGQVVPEGHAVVPGGGGAVGVDHSPPRHRAAVDGHDA